MTKKHTPRPYSQRLAKILRPAIKAAISEELIRVITSDPAFWEEVEEVIHEDLRDRRPGCLNQDDDGNLVAQFELGDDLSKPLLYLPLRVDDLILLGSYDDPEEYERRLALAEKLQGHLQQAIEQMKKDQKERQDAL